MESDNIQQETKNLLFPSTSVRFTNDKVEQSVGLVEVVTGVSNDKPKNEEKPSKTKW